ncbi:21985_t:CDS:2 [Dentiscutata erythropus]|uniref:21985_t:CDS:1 n=1 Tax=Dentiscutata erythropus TaxID=1348616 RepID=A0A9N9I8U1_9GLOM|nr:21985_t:CDS:2 [Dentiscutata erythropus]
MTSTKVGSKSHDSENCLQVCSAIKKSYYPNTKRIYEKLDKFEEKFCLLEEEIDDLTDKALEINNTSNSETELSDDILPDVITVKKIHESKDLSSIHSKPKKK